MEGSKYSQHNQSNNITCMIILSHIGRILSRWDMYLSPFTQKIKQMDNIGKCDFYPSNLESRIGQLSLSGTAQKNKISQAIL